MDKPENKNMQVDMPQAIHLAVDLIQLLEENTLDNEVVIEALDIALKDFKNKKIRGK